MNKLTVALSSVLVLALLLTGGCVLFTNHIYNRQDCTQFNIDNIEVRTGIDIPKVVDVDCTCDKVAHTKKAAFTLNVEALNIETYLQRNNFKKQGAVYVNNGKREDTEWQATLDVTAKALVVDLKYLD